MKQKASPADVPVYLFKQGNNFESQRFFGAHFENVGETEGDAFCFILNILPLSGRGLGRAAAAGRCPRRRHIRRRPFRLKHE